MVNNADANSYTNELTVKLKEIELQQVDDASQRLEKLSATFKAFDQYLPMMGILQNVFQLIRDELFDGVYSNLVSTNQDGGLVKIPYCVLNDRMSTICDEKCAHLSSKLESVSKRLEQCNNLLQQRESAIDDLGSQVRNVEEVNIGLMKQIEDASKKNQKLQGKVKNLEHALLKEKLEKNRMLNDSKVETLHLKKNISKLEKYKDEYDKVSCDFQNDDVLSTKKYHIEYLSTESNVRKNRLLEDLNVMEKLRLQLLTLRNKAIDEYDKYLADCKRKEWNMSRKKSIFGSTILEEEEDLNSMKALIIIKKRFMGSVTKVSKEVELLDEQKKCIYKQLEGISAGSVPDKINQNLKKCETENENLFQIMEGKHRNPFVPLQQNLNRFSFMLFSSSNNGKSYLEIPGASFCESCNEKTFSCPHKVTQEEVVVAFTSPCTNLKIIRPKIQLSCIRSNSNPGVVSERNTEVVSETEKIVNFKERVWSWFYTNYKEVPLVTRCLNKDDLLERVYEFYAYMLWVDDQSEDTEYCLSFLGSLERFYDERYTLKEVASLAVLELIQGTEKVSEDSLDLQIFGQYCTGNLDSAVFRYLLIVADLINRFGFQSMDDVETFFKIIYNFASEDEIEALKIGYVSFSENKANKKMLLQYVTWLIMKKKEPRIIEVGVSLASIPVRYRGFFSDVEFSEAVENIVTLYSEQLRWKLFNISQRSYTERKQHINIEKAACISAFFQISQHSKSMVDVIDQYNLEHSSRQNLSSQSNELIGYACLKSLSNEFERRRMASTLSTSL